MPSAWGPSKYIATRAGRICSDETLRALGGEQSSQSVPEIPAGRLRIRLIHALGSAGS